VRVERVVVAHQRRRLERHVMHHQRLRRREVVAGEAVPA
jgi:hypothetical protein